MGEVTLESTWEELFGKTSCDITATDRRMRWEKWRKGAGGYAEYWEDQSACEGCHCNDDGWCLYQNLPVTVSPFLTFNYGMMGMACMGMRPEADVQVELW